MTATPGDPVSAYDVIAPDFAQLTAARLPYLDGVDAIVSRSIPHGANSLLDVGAGDARRARKIAAAAAIERIVLLEPGAGMRRLSTSQSGYVDLRAEQLSSLAGEFDVILCLWNVLGHVFPLSERQQALCQCARLLSSGGRMFLDVTHRYNMAQYGFACTAARYVYDHLRPAESNGDVVATWRLGGRQASVRGHVFTDTEFRGMTRRAGLEVERRYVLDYRTGGVRRFGLQGNLLYVMKRSS